MHRFTLILLITQIFCAIMHSTQAQEILPSDLKEIIENLPDEEDIWNDADDALLREQNYKFTINHTDEAVPDNFDSRVKWPNCPSIKRIIFQGKCGSCWAHATAAVISDRTCIASNQKVQRVFSVEDLISCCPETCWNKGKLGKERGRCNGGLVSQAVKFWIEEGLVTGGHINTSEGCKPLSQGTYNETYKSIPQCQKKCTNDKYKVSYLRDKMFGRNMGELKAPFDLKTLQIEIMKNGPVIGNIGSTPFFQKHGWESRDIFMGGGNETELNGHAIRLIGWGVEGNISYWLVANTWGDKWGEDGFFRILRGVNLQEIEKKALAPYVREESLPSGTISLTLSTSTFLISFCLIILRAFS